MKLSWLPKLFLVFACLTMGAALLPSMQQSAYAQSKMSPPVTGQNLLVAHFPGGRFELTGPGSWGEYDANGQRRYTFREVRRDQDTVYLREDGLNVDVELNATRRTIMAAWPGRSRHQLHRMDRVEAEPRTGGPLVVTPPIPPSPPVRPIPPAPPSAPFLVTSENVTKAIYSGGRFEEAGAGTGIWTQFSNTGGVSTFGEIGHDDATVFLFDQNRNVLALLDVNDRMIRESRNGGRLEKRHTGVDMQAASQPPRPDYALNPVERAQCLASGGIVERAGILGAERCTLTYGDAGKVCTDSSQCQGKCIAELAGANQASTGGTCQRTDNPFGCYAEVENGRTGPALCVD